MRIIFVISRLATPSSHFRFIVVTRTLTWQDLKADQERCLQRLASICLRAGYYPPGSSKQLIVPATSQYHSSTHSSEPPFDRHDWIIRRPKTGEEVRYVIDYYSAPPEADGSPVFSLDVRPALDSFSSLKERIAVATEEVWAAAREKTKSADARSSLRRES